MPFKDFSDLKALRKDLKAQEQTRKKEQAERLRQEKQSQHDADLFRRSIGDVAPLAPTDKSICPAPRPLPVARVHAADEPAALPQSLSDEFSLDTPLDTDEAFSFVRPGVGADVLRKLRRGHWTVQAELDLHGLRIDQARQALIAFLCDAKKRRLRCVKIIHGKGWGSFNREPVLKNKVRNWLVQKDVVIVFCQARASQGGAGALVVLLTD